MPGVYLLGWRLTDWLAGEPTFRHLLAPSAALATFVLAVGILGRAAGSFIHGLWIGTLTLSLLGVTWSVFRKIRASSDSVAPNAVGLDGAPPSGVSARSRRASRQMLLSGLAFALPIAFLTLKGDFFDDFNLIGHRSLIAQFQNDVFPPRHQVYPEYPFRYHYGFNLVAAAVTGLFRTSVGAAIDVVVLAGFLWSWCLAWRLGERLTRSQTGWWTPLGGLFGGGAFFWFLWHSDWAQYGAIGIVIGGNRINHPAIMYFFQKPFALGFPLALAVMLTVSFRPRPSSWWRRTLLLALLLAPLSLAQVVLFVTIGPCVAAQDFLSERKLRAVVPLLLAVLLAVPLGGVLFSSMPSDQANLLQARFWPAHNDPMGVLAWYFLTTGILIPLALMGVLAMPRMRAFFLLLVVGSFSVPLFFVNPGSWDIVKFSTVGQFAAGLAGGSALAWVAASKSWRRLPALIMLVLLLVASPVGYLGYWIREMVLPTPEIGQRLEAQSKSYANEHWLSLIAWLRQRSPTQWTIYCKNGLLLRELLFAGLNTAGPPGVINPQFGIPPKRIASRKVLLQELPSDQRRWLEEGVLWVVTGPGEPLGETVRSWVATGEARRVAAAGPWSLYQLVRPPDHSGPP